MVCKRLGQMNEEKADQNEASEMKQLANTSEMEQMAEDLQEAAKACGPACQYQVCVTNAALLQQARHGHCEKAAFVLKPGTIPMNQQGGPFGAFLLGRMVKLWTHEIALSPCHSQTLVPIHHANIHCPTWPEANLKARLPCKPFQWQLCPPLRPCQGL